MNKTTTLLLAALPLGISACISPETGIDDTTLSGRVQIPPAPTALVDSTPDGDRGARDTFDTAMDLGDLSFRWQQVTSEMRQFGGENADEDWFLFSPAVTGAFSVRLAFGGASVFMPTGTTGTGTTGTGTTGTGTTGTGTTGTGGDTADTGGAGGGDTGGAGGVDTGTGSNGIEMLVEVYAEADLITSTTDGSTFFPAGSALASGYTEGDSGVLELVLSGEQYDDGTGETYTGLKGGAKYFVRVVGLANPDNLSGDYSLWFSGSDPNDGQLLVGAYEPFGGDFQARGNPVAGSTIRNWELDEQTLTWTGDYEMLYFRTVETTPREDDPERAVHEVSIGITEVELAATDGSTLNQGLLGGTFYSSQTLVMQVEPDTDNRAEGFLVFDAFAEAAAGWTQEEIEPNDVEIDPGTYNLVEAPGGLAQELPIGSGVGYIDTITGVLTYAADDPEWVGSDSDIFALTVSEPVNAVITASWPNGAVNADLHIYDENGEIWGAGWSESGDGNPEFLTTAYWGIELTPDSTWYIGLHPYFGPAGDNEYEITIEWVGL